MSEFGLDRSGAIAWAGNYHTEAKKKFIYGLTKVPSWGPSTDALVKEYLDGLAICARASNCWSYEIQRFRELPISM